MLLTAPYPFNESQCFALEKESSHKTISTKMAHSRARPNSPVTKLLKIMTTRTSLAGLPIVNNFSLFTGQMCQKSVHLVADLGSVSSACKIQS